MKKFTKIALVCVLVCFVLGVGVLLAGLLLGGSWWELRERMDHENSLLGILYENHDVEELHPFEELEPWEDEDFSESSYTNVQKIEVDMKSGGLYFEPSKDGQFDVAVNGDETKGITIRQNGDELEIHNNLRNYKGKVIISYPQDWNFREISISMGGGEVSVQGNLYAEQFDAECAACVFHADYIQAEESNWEVGAGEIVVDRIESRNIDFDCGKGTIRANIVGAQTDFNYDIECGMGSVEIGDDRYSGLAVDKTINNGQNREIEIACGMGAVELSFEQ